MHSNLAFAVKVCRLIEMVAPQFGAHVALTGGSLYKDGDRKDLDILFYRIRQAPKVDTEKLFAALEVLGFKKPEGMGWLFKSEFENVAIDMFFPEEIEGGIYGIAARDQTAINCARIPEPPQW